MRTIRSLLYSVTALVLACGCGNDDSPFANADPRCAAVCAIRTPSLEGAFDVCSMDSAAACLEQCEIRIADVATVCAGCLLERASFRTDPIDISSDCTASGCIIYGRAGSCSYPPGNAAAEDDCLRQVYPRREVDCEVSFRPVNDCAEVCG